MKTRQLIAAAVALTALTSTAHQASAQSCALRTRCIPNDINCILAKASFCNDEVGLWFEAQDIFLIETGVDIDDPANSQCWIDPHIMLLSQYEVELRCAQNDPHNHSACSAIQEPPVHFLIGIDYQDGQWMTQQRYKAQVLHWFSHCALGDFDPWRVITPGLWSWVDDPLL